MPSPAALRVGVGLYIVNLAHLDPASGQFDADFFLYLRSPWKDPYPPKDFAGVFCCCLP